MVALTAWPGVLWADWAGLQRFAAIAEIRVDQGSVGVKLRFADGAVPAAPVDPESVAARLLELRDGDGKPLNGAVADFRHVVPDPAGGAADTEPPHDEATLNYPLPAGARSLTIAPVARLRSDVVGVIVLHRGVPVSDLSALDRTLRLSLDEVDPWRTHFDDPERIRRHFEPRSYVYVEPYEVRHELLIRLKDLAAAMDLGLRRPDVVDIDERADVKKRIGEFLLHRNPVSIDGTDVKPQVDRIEFVGFSRNGVQPVPESLPLESSDALVGAVIGYLTERPASRLTLHWDVFGAAQDRAVSVLQGRESFDGYMTRARPDFQWSQEDAMDSPVAVDEGGASLPLGAGDLATMDEAQLKALLQSLLHNAYRAFALRDEEEVYDRLAKSLEDPLLEEIYLQQRRSLTQQTKGLGGEGRVERIDVMDAYLADATGPTARVDVRWMAHGTVSHWGHSHPRHNLYLARLSLHHSDDDGWKIVGMRLQDGQRLEVAAHP